MNHAEARRSSSPSVGGRAHLVAAASAIAARRSAGDFQLLPKGGRLELHPLDDLQGGGGGVDTASWGGYQRSSPP